MEFRKEEVTAVEQAAEVNEQEVRPLSELQLALIGGGIGDVVWA